MHDLEKARRSALGTRYLTVVEAGETCETSETSETSGTSETDDN